MFDKLNILIVVLAFALALTGADLNIRFLYLAGWVLTMIAVLLFAGYCLYHEHTNFKHWK